MSTGNTHRAEICIDKLYSPDGPTGRLGLVEFRAFEMPPHARMSLVQHPLLRALIKLVPGASPTSGRPDPLGHRAARPVHAAPLRLAPDLEDVIADLPARAPGLPLESDWFAPHFEFRFPTYGQRRPPRRSPGAAPCARAVACTGRAGRDRRHPRGLSIPRSSGCRSAVRRHQHRTAPRSPATATGSPCTGPPSKTASSSPGCAILAWQPPSCPAPDHPASTRRWSSISTTLGRNARSAAAPITSPIRAGANYDTFPVNAYEAESRRLARFLPFGHTPGPRWAPPPERRHAEFPFTLDLRRAAGV